MRLTRPGGEILVPLIVGSAAFIQAFDVSSVVVALPEMARLFGVRPLELNIVITAYLMGATAFLPLCGWAAERFGARATFLFAIGSFGLGALGCAAATDLGWLVAARVVQGAAGALLLPVGRIILLNAVPREGLIQAMATLTIPVLLGPVLGPSLGGLIVSHLSWRGLFLFQIPVALVGLILVWRYLPSIAASRARPLDWLGFALLSGAVVSLTYAVSLASRDDVAAGLILAMLAFGAIAGLAYAFHARRHPHPIVDFGVLRVPTVSATNIGGLFPRMLVSGTPFLLTLLFQVTFGLSAFEAGGLLFASALGSLSGRRLLGVMLRRWGFRRTLTGNSLAVAALVGVCAAFTADTPVWLVCALLFAQGLLRTLHLTAVMTLSYADLDENQFSAASTISSLSQQIAMSAGIAVAVLTIQATQAIRGDASLNTAAIAPGFLVLALVSLVSLLWIRRLPADVGVRLTGGRKAALDRVGREEDL